MYGTKSIYHGGNYLKNKFITLDTHFADGKVEGNNLIGLALVFGTQVYMHRYKKILP